MTGRRVGTISWFDGYRKITVPQFTEHPLRQALEMEAHARPPVAITAPGRISHLAAASGEGRGGEELEHLNRLCSHFKATPPGRDATQADIDLGPFRLKWERHTEFATYTFICEGAFQAPFKEPVIADVPEDWLAELPGEIVHAFHFAIEAGDGEARSLDAIAALFDNNAVLAGDVSDGNATMWTDFRLHTDRFGRVLSDGNATMWTDFRLHTDRFGRVLIRTNDLGAEATGRLVQRIAEMETYRAMAMLAFPMARDARGPIARSEEELASIIAGLADVEGTDAERRTLSDLSRLAAEAEKVASGVAYRFAAARAYHAIVKNRMESLRESRIVGYQRITAFVANRLEPAMETCENLARRLEVLAERISRASDLLRTRVDVALEAQNRDLLASMDRRARLQLRLQETVEGLPVVAISYYLLSLVSYLAKGAKAAVLSAVDPFIVTAIAFLPVVGLVWYGVRRVRRAITGKEEA